MKDLWLFTERKWWGGKTIYGSDDKNVLFFQYMTKLKNKKNVAEPFKIPVSGYLIKSNGAGYYNHYLIFYPDGSCEASNYYKYMIYNNQLKNRSDQALCHLVKFKLIQENKFEISNILEVKEKYLNYLDQISNLENDMKKLNNKLSYRENPLLPG